MFKYQPRGTPQTMAGPDGVETKSIREAHKEQVRVLNRSTDAAIVMQGGDVTAL